MTKPSKYGMVDDLFKVFEFELLRFEFDPTTSRFNPIKNDLSTKTCLQISTNKTEINRDQLRKTFGENTLDIP